MRSSVKRFWADQAGSTAIEYALIAGVVGIFMITGIAQFGGTGGGIFADILAKVSSAIGG